MRRVKNKDSLSRAREYAFLLLKFRLRSEKEIYERLKKKKFEEAAARQTVSFLIGKGLLDDNGFAKAWIESRLKRPLGLRRIERELVQKGISKGIIKRQLDALRGDYCEEGLVLGIAKERAEKVKHLEPDKAKRRIYAYLLRRGFSLASVVEAINKL